MYAVSSLVRNLTFFSYCLLFFSETAGASNFRQFMPSQSGTLKSQVFTTSGTWIRPAGVTVVTVEIQGAGGGGGGGSWRDTTCGGGNWGTSSGGGGGAGAFVVSERFAVSDNVSVTVGTGGNGGSGATGSMAVGGYYIGTGITSGSPGSASCFGTLCADGGPGGLYGGTADSTVGTVKPNGGGLSNTGGDATNIDGQGLINSLASYRSVMFTGGGTGGANFCSSFWTAGKGGAIPSITAPIAAGGATGGGGSGGSSAIASGGAGAPAQNAAACVGGAGGIGAGGGGGGALRTATRPSPCNGGAGGNGQVTVYWSE